jgi:hypothetical protein
MADNVTGINTSKIAKMQTAIEDWAKAVDAAKITVSSKNVIAAIKGNTQEAQVKSLCQACDSYTNTLTAKLRAYKARLDEVKVAYQKNDADSTAISSVTSAVKNLKS